LLGFFLFLNKFIYIINHTQTGQPVKVPDRGWRWKQDTFEEAALIKDGHYTNIEERFDGSFICGRIWFAKDENTQTSSIKFLDEVEDFLLRRLVQVTEHR
jgi:adenine-specific DNA-methyltransferase